MTDRIPNLVSITTAAARFGVDESTMRRAVLAGHVKAKQLRPGGTWRVYIDDDGAPVTVRASSRRRA
jgi:hypothetical protein